MFNPTKFLRPRSTLIRLGLLTVTLLIAGQSISAPKPETFKWRVVANNGDFIPSSEKNFNSYNQPSVNAKGLVVFRARSRGPQPLSGIFLRDMSGRGGELIKVADRLTEVPQPNNTEYPKDSGNLATFNEFPSIPRISISSDFVVTRGNSQPVWTYVAEEGETRAGTSGLYMQVEGMTLVTAVSQLGAVPEFLHFSVPGAGPGVMFDQFPGAPSVTDEGIITFKGNYSESETPKTGVYYRNVIDSNSPVELVANSGMTLPNASAGVLFGSAAPPSAASGAMVFVGFDDEENPLHGGIYHALLIPDPTLNTLVGLESEVPGEDTTYSRFEEALSFDGRFVAFWGSWGDQTQTLKLFCPTEGNRDRIAFCNENPETKDGFEVEVPVNQGIFVHDTKHDITQMVAKTGEQYDDFLYWNYSGAPPGAGDGHSDQEPPRWRSSAFVAVTSNGTANWVAFKARAGEIVNMSYTNLVDGIYLSKNPGQSTTVTIIDTTMHGQQFDPAAPEDSKITSVGFERDGLRGNWLVINASMGVEGNHAEEEESMAGIYLMRVK